MTGVEKSTFCNANTWRRILRRGSDGKGGEEK
jgi:hypothetical protein